MKPLNRSTEFTATYPLLNGQYIPLLRAVGSYPRPLGKIIRNEWGRGANGQMYQQVEIIAAIAECPKCLQRVELIADTESWTWRGGKWFHQHLGPAQGDCCGMLIVDSFDGCWVYELGNA